MYYEQTYIGTTSKPVKFSGLFDNILQGLQAGLQVFSAIGGAQNQSGQPKPIKGNNATRQYVSEVLQALDTILAIAQAPIQQNAQQILQQAQAIVATLSNPTVIYQARTGTDARILNEGKAAANAKLREIIQALQNVSVTTIPDTVVNQTGQTVVAGGTLVQTLLAPENVPLLLGAGILVYLIVKK